MYRHRLLLVFRSASGQQLRVDAGYLLWRGWRRLDLELPGQLSETSRLSELSGEHLFEGILIQSSPAGKAGDVALSIENLLNLADADPAAYPGGVDLQLAIRRGEFH